MKKGIIVLLIAVLVAGFAFAGKLTGSAGLSFKVDLDNKTWGFSNDKAWKYTFNFEFDTTKVEVGEHQCHGGDNSYCGERPLGQLGEPISRHQHPCGKGQHGHRGVVAPQS